MVGPSRRQLLVQRKRDKIIDFLAPYLAEGEVVGAIVVSASGPLWPGLVLVPVLGILAMFTRLIRVYALVATDRRVLLVRRSKVRPGWPQSLDREVPLGRVAVLSWKPRQRRGMLILGMDGRRMRFHLFVPFMADVPALIDALAPPADEA